MIYISNRASDEDVLQIVQTWVDIWAEHGPEAALTAISLDRNDTWTPELLEYAVTSYHQSELYPNTSRFIVTSPTAATVANHMPMREVKWYAPNSTGLAGDVRFDLSLNGRWSDLLADFDLWVSNALDESYLLTLDEIRCWDQYWSEQEQISP